MTDRDDTSHPAERLQGWKKHPILRVTATYMVSAWAIVQVCEVVLPAYDVPENVMPLIINTLIALFPIVILVARITPVWRLVLPDAEAAKRTGIGTEARPETSTEVTAEVTAEVKADKEDVSEADEILRLRGAELEFPVALSERRSITTVACAVRGVRAGKNDPELLIGVLPSVEVEIQSIVDRYEGTRLTSGRNQIVVAFGYPVMHEDDVRRAACAAREIIALLHATDKDDDPDTLIVSQAGLHTDVVIIDDGASGAEPVSLLGDNTTIAEWLLAFAPDNGVAVSAESAGLLESFFFVEETDRFSHPRIGNEVPVFRLGMEYTGQLQQITDGSAQLLGRELEHRKILDHWQTVVDGESQYVLLVGEPGIGKSTLLSHAVHDLVKGHAPELVVLNCESYDQGSSLRAVINYFERELFGSDYTMPHEQRLAKLSEFLDSVPVDNAEALPLLAKLLAIESDDPDLRVDDSNRLVREKTLSLLVDLLHGGAENRPLLLVVEDLQWADPSTTDLVERLLTESSERRILGLFTSRPDAQTGWSRFSHISIINLSRLPSRVTGDMIRARLGDVTISEPLVERIVAESGGVPLYVEELIRGLKESADSLGTDDEDSLSIPPSLQSALAARVDRLGASKSLLQLCSVLGHEFTFQLLKRVVTSDNEDLLRKILADLVSEGMLYRKGAYPDVTFKFKHRLIMEAAYRSLITKTRQQLHAAIAGTIEASFPELCATFPVRLAQHFDRAGNAGKAVHYRVMAAQLAQSQFANGEALLQLSRGLDALQGIRDTQQRDFAELALQNLKGSVLLASRGFTNEDAMLAFERAVELSDGVANSPELFRMVVGLWMYYLIKGDYSQAGKLSKRLMTLAEERGGAPELLQANYCVGYSVFYTGCLSDALQRFLRSVEFEEPGQDYTRQTPSRDDSRVHARCLLALTLWYTGHGAQAKKQLDEAARLAVEVQQPYARVWCLFQTTWLYHACGDFDAMAVAAADCVAIGQEKGISFFVPLGLFFQASQSANAQERLTGMLRYHEIILTTGARSGNSYLKMMIADELLAQGRLEEAALGLQETRELIASMNERLWEGELLRLEAKLALQQGGSAAATAVMLLRDSIDFNRRINNKPFALRSALTLHECTDGSSESATLLEEIVSSYPAADSTAEFKRAQQVLREGQPPKLIPH